MTEIHIQHVNHYVLNRKEPPTMNPKSISLQHTAFQQIINNIRRELGEMGYDSTVEVHGFSIQEVQPATATYDGNGVLNAALFIANRFHVEIHLDMDTSLNTVNDMKYTGLGITLVDTESSSADTTDDADIHDYHIFNTPHIIEVVHVVVADHVIDTIAACDSI